MHDCQYRWIDTGEPATDAQLKDLYNDALDDAGDVQIGTLSYAPSRVLASVDPIAYRIGLSEFIDAQIGETIAEVWS